MTVTMTSLFLSVHYTVEQDGDTNFPIHEFDSFWLYIAIIISILLYYSKTLGN